MFLTLQFSLAGFGDALFYVARPLLSNKHYTKQFGWIGSRLLLAHSDLPEKAINGG